MSRPTLAADSRTDRSMTLAEFLAWPEIDEKPYLEYIDGRIEEKLSPQARHSLIQLNLPPALNAFALPRRLGLALPELRCTFGGRSIIPDVVFLLDASIRTDERGDIVDEIMTPPDIHVEIRSPDQSKARTVEKIEHSIAQGCPLGWFIDPDQRNIRVYRPGRAVEVLGADGVLDGDPILPGFRLAVAEVFGWLVYRKPKADPS